ncbi:hypothetical protein L6164_004236 [Bauhinia variegata]|uniref:Uncharacterized protein n=1 Tax=Bauhinia variegata TaxID=167791 RepID=A0ACB9Q3Q3_BAUVA|nr:hypothetical protein L6164_004236 [Bauhinia variegata]
MKGRFCCFILALQIVSWVSAARRPFPPTDGISHPEISLSASFSGINSAHSALSGLEEAPLPSPYALESNKGLKSTESVSNAVSKIGSSPPSCEHKCYGCSPCEAIQVPSTSRRSHFGIQYANYEPESWKCKCGPSLYSP